ncbi:MAG: methyltransferase domain-containing protein [Kofleriaceae bacterium]
MSFADHFSAVARTYATFRPHYPNTLASELASRCASTELAWDAGCGNGQLSIALAAQFEQVVATDPAQAQLDAAERHAHVEYRCEPAEKCSLGDRSVDLAVSAQAAHWFAWPAYSAEVARVTRPGALVALVSYGIVEVEGERAAAIVGHYYRDIAGPYWPAGREHVENGYRDLAWPRHWSTVEPPRLAMTAQWTREQLLGYVASWSATVRLVDAQGPAPYEALGEELAAAWPGGTRTVRWPLTLRLARVAP